MFSADANVENKTYYEAGGAKRHQFRPRAGQRKTNPKTAQSVQTPSAKVLQNGQSVQVANAPKEGVKIATFNNFDQDEIEPQIIAKPKTRHNALKVVFLGGVGEIGKNITALEYGDDILLIVWGVAGLTKSARTLQ